MILYRHHSLDDLIDLDDISGAMRELAEDDPATPHPGGLPVTMRADASVCGSYTIEDGRRCCLYWHHDQLILRTPEQCRLALFRREADRLLTDLLPGGAIAMQADGDMATFTLRDGSGASLFAITYAARRYQAMFGMGGMIAYTPDETLGDFDFFVGVRDAVDELKTIAAACAALAGSAAPIDGLVMARSGQTCPRAGLWAACRHLDTWRDLATGACLPPIEGAAVDWVWVRE